MRLIVGGKLKGKSGHSGPYRFALPAVSNFEKSRARQNASCSFSAIAKSGSFRAGSISLARQAPCPLPDRSTATIGGLRATLCHLQQETRPDRQYGLPPFVVRQADWCGHCRARMRGRSLQGYRHVADACAADARFRAAMTPACSVDMGQAEVALYEQVGKTI